jgi:hypothetical protein
MRKLAKAIMQVPLTASLMAAKRLAGVVNLSPDENASSDLILRLEKQFVRFMTEAFKVGDQLTVDKLDPLLNALTRSGLTSGLILKSGMDAVSQLLEHVSPHFHGSQNQLVLREFGNKLQSFGTFRYVGSVLDLAPGEKSSLTAMVAKTQELNAYTKVWATEGLGYLNMEQIWQKGCLPEGVLRDAGLEELPRGCWVALHAGMGLSLAKNNLKNATPQTPMKDLENIVQQFADLCASNARSGYAAICFEALGLVVQTQYPELRLHFDRILGNRYPEGVAYFWHGVGRGVYFMPRSSLAWRKNEWAEMRAPHPVGRLNLLSGLAWPLTLVNIRHPEIMAQFISRHGDYLEGNDAFATGVGAAIMIWRNATEGDDYLDSFCRLELSTSNQNLNRRWAEWIHEPCQVANSTVYDSIRDQNSFEGLFRYSSLAELTRA